jgi:hypothetical protein
MDEQAALDVIAVRAVEIRDGARTLWTDSDRAWASRAAAEVVGERADAGTFIARRGRLALERLGERSKALPRAVRALRWRPWVGWMIVTAAFVVGATLDRIGGVQRINLLAPPVFALLLWNLAVYATLAAGFLVRYGDTGPPGPLRGLVMRIAARAGRGIRRGRRGNDDVIGDSIAALTTDWARLAASLYAARAARILHLAAAALALGVIAGLYVRGLAFEYRATWESTFLDPAKVRALLAAALAPGALLTGIAVPDEAHVAAIRAPAGENAATWLHLMAASVCMVVIIPRLVLATWAALLERYRATRLPLALGESYWRRLLRGFEGGPVRVLAIPYSYALPPAALAGLEAIVERAFGGGAALTVAAPVAYGVDDHATHQAPDSAGPVIALFNLTATPEPGVHGAFVAAERARRWPAQPLLAIVDESAFRTRWPDDERRLGQRRGLWSSLLTGERLAPIFVNLVTPDLALAETAIDAALGADGARESDLRSAP